MTDSIVLHGKSEDESAEHKEVCATNNAVTKGLRCKGFTLPHRFLTCRKRIQKMEIRSGDIWLCGLPRSGTTRIQEALWCIANDADLDAAKKLRLKERFPHLDETCVKGTRTQLEDTNASSEVPEGFLMDSIAIVEQLPSPRFVKSHLPLVLLPQGLLLKSEAKVVYVSRNPRDLCISHYRYAKDVRGYKKDFETFVDTFLKGGVIYTPYWEHVLQFWRIRNNPNVLFIIYEEMKKDLKKVISKIAKFLGKTLSEQQILNLTNHLSFENMKHNHQVNREPESEKSLAHGSDQKVPFMRCGQSGQWKGVMPQAMIQKFEKWEEEHLKETDYTYSLTLE